MVLFVLIVINKLIVCFLGLKQTYRWGLVFEKQESLQVFASNGRPS